MMHPARPEPGNDEVSSLLGRRVVDERGALVGTVSAVVHEDGAPDPDWLVVDSRWRRSGRYVPVEGAYQSPAGDLVVPFDKAWVIAAPRMRPRRPALDYALRRRLATHYGDSYDWWSRGHAGAVLVT